MMKTETVKLSQIAVNEHNPRTISKEKFNDLIKSILILPKMLSLRPIVTDDTLVVLGGNMRLRALTAIADMSSADINDRLGSISGFTQKTEAEQDMLRDYWAKWVAKPTAEIVKASELSEAEQREFIIKDNIGFGEWDNDMLANEWEAADLKDWGMDIPWDDPDNGDGNSSSGSSDGSGNGSLNDRFIVPPFSILDTRKGYWQKRKYDVWRPLIGDMGESREDTLIASLEIKYKDIYLKTKKHRAELGISFREYLDKYVSEEEKEREAKKTLGAGVSLFDPVLSEIICKWFTPSQGASIFDCFAGDTQKGLVFGYCGYPFTGVELRQEQIDINNRVLEGRDLPVRYICDDGRNVSNHFAPESQDLLFSCPPYFDLEKYSDLDNDASNQKSYADFIAILDTAFKSALTCLKNNRFAVIVVGDVRNKRTGCYYDFCGDIKRIMREGGAELYNEIILVETGASTALRAGRYMESRKVAKMHQNILVFFKGNPKEIKNEFPKIEYTQDDLTAFGKETESEINPDEQ